jgi:hypothetical protein
VVGGVAGVEVADGEFWLGPPSSLNATIVPAPLWRASVGSERLLPSTSKM